MKESKYRFERLTPIDSVPLDVYEDAINYAFDNSDIKNVAISGAYSSGKSSVLASYKKKHSDLTFLHISLAQFQTLGQEGDDVNESVLEGKLLNQLIHQLRSDKIPQTNFRVKKKISSYSIIKVTIEVILIFITIIYFACFDIWKNYVNTLPDNGIKSILLLSTNQYALIIDGILILGLLSIIIYGFIKVQKNKNVFRKLNLQGNEIEIFAESDDSYFDKYLNEVLYLFENAEVDAIVFEDIDRFNVNRIFDRLREVNTLVNIQLKKEEEKFFIFKKNKKILRFFYLLRDDIFSSKDRTKFFDYIIPVVPVLDSSNSYDQFIAHFKKGELFEKFNEDFLQGLSLYIDDMRLLKNIYNEFVIYYNRLNITELDCNKMLAIIAYKNLFPRDFADLQLNQGFVYTIFDKTDEFIAAEIKRLEEQISDKSQTIEMAQKEHLIVIEELDTIYEAKKRQNRYGNRLSDTDQSDYARRKQAIENCLNNKIPELENEKTFLEQELILTQNKKLHDIITRDNICHIFSVKSVNEIGHETCFSEIKSSEYFDLLKYLIRNGYIDETYADYMTYFYDHSISRIDKTFLRSITDKKTKEYTYKLKNPQLVISRLRLVDFDQEEALNFDLLTYLLHAQSYTEYIEKFIDQLKNKKNFKFMGAFFDTTTELPAYIKYLNMRWPETLITALNEQLLTEKQIRRYTICSIYYSDDTTIKLVNKDNCLCDYISNAQDYLAIDNPKIDRLVHAFVLLRVRFIGFDYAILDKSLFHTVYEESLYEINAENLQLIQREILGITSDEDIYHKNYTLLYSHHNSAITKYVNKNINEYFNVVMQICKGTILDDESVAIMVLNNSDITHEQKISYISVLKTNIIFIKDIKDSSLWSRLLDAKIVEYSEQNIMDCFKALKLSESVIDYINRCNIDLDFSKLDNDREDKEELFDDIIVCNFIENAKYETILVSLNFSCDEFSTTDILNDKITILITTKIIGMTAKTLKFMRENYPNQIFYFVHKNIDKYVDIMQVELFSQDELLEILSSDIIDELKIKLLKFSNEEISIIGNNYSLEVCLYILSNNFMKSDSMALFSSFEKWDSSIQTKILDFAVKDITDIIDNHNCISKKMKRDLLGSNILNKDTKINLLIAMISDVDEEELKELLTSLDLTNYLKIFDTRSRPRFEINDESKKLLTSFKESNLIDNYEESSTKEGYYKIIRGNINK